MSPRFSHSTNQGEESARTRLARRPRARLPPGFGSAAGPTHGVTEAKPEVLAGPGYDLAGLDLGLDEPYLAGPSLEIRRCHGSSFYEIQSTIWSTPPSVASMMTSVPSASSGPRTTPRLMSQTGCSGDGAGETRTGALLKPSSPKGPLSACNTAAVALRVAACRAIEIARSLVMATGDETGEGLEPIVETSEGLAGGGVVGPGRTLGEQPARTITATRAPITLRPRTIKRTTPRDRSHPRRLASAYRRFHGPTEEPDRQAP